MDSDGENRYDPSQPDSIYIGQGGRLSIVSAAVVPTNPATLGGLGLMSLAVLRHRQSA